MKNPLIPAGIEPATFQFVAQHPSMKVQVNFYHTTRSNIPGDITFICDRVVLRIFKPFARGSQQSLKGTSAVQYWKW